MEISTARKLAVVITSIRVVFVAFVGFVGALLLAVLPFESCNCTHRDFLYGVQRHLLWPIGIHLNDARWHFVYALMEDVGEGPVILLALLLGALAALYFARGWLRRSHNNAVQNHRPKGYPTCAGCWYNVTGNQSGICPECGTDLKANAGD